MALLTVGPTFDQAKNKINKIFIGQYSYFYIQNCHIYLAHVIEQPNFQIPNSQYFVYLLDQTVGRDILQFIY